MQRPSLLSLFFLTFWSGQGTFPPRNCIFGSARNQKVHDMHKSIDGGKKNISGYPTKVKTIITCIIGEGSRRSVKKKVVLVEREGA